MTEKLSGRFAWLIVVGVVSGWLFISLDGNHYWHDVRFAYAASEFSLTEVFEGLYNPHQAWTHSNEVSSSGFYISKMFHIILLNSLFTVVNPDAGGFDIAIVFSVLLMVLAIGLIYFFYSRLFRSKELALIAAVCIMLAPVVPYMTGKFFSENTSLLFVIISLILFEKGSRYEKNKSILLVIGSGLFLAIAALTRIDSLFGPIGFMIAMFMFPLDGIKRSVLARTMLIVAITFIFTYFSALFVAGVNALNLVDYFLVFVNAGQKSVLMSLMGIATFAGSVYLLSLSGLFNKQVQLVRFLVSWCVLSLLPALLITWHYMVEPRYLIQGLIPLCALAALGVMTLRKQCSEKGINSTVIGLVFVTLTLVINFISVRLMPYELDRPEMMAAVSSIKNKNPEAAILVPWSYTDYNYLRLVLPESNIYNVNSPVNFSIDNAIETQWQSRFKQWYGDRYIINKGRVEELLKHGEVYYLGWRVYPPVQNVIDFANIIDLTPLSEALNDMQMTDHRQESWIWASPDYKLELSGRSGQYEYYRVSFNDL